MRVSCDFKSNYRQLVYPTNLPLRFSKAQWPPDLYSCFSQNLYKFSPEIEGWTVVDILPHHPEPLVRTEGPISPASRRLTPNSSELSLWVGLR